MAFAVQPVVPDKGNLPPSIEAALDGTMLHALEHVGLVGDINPYYRRENALLTGAAIRAAGCLAAIWQAGLDPAGAENLTSDGVPFSLKSVLNNDYDASYSTGIFSNSELCRLVAQTNLLFKDVAAEQPHYALTLASNNLLEAHGTDNLRKLPLLRTLGCGATMSAGVTMAAGIYTGYRIGEAVTHDMLVSGMQAGIAGYLTLLGNTRLNHVRYLYIARDVRRRIVSEHDNPVES